MAGLHHASHYDQKDETVNRVLHDAMRTSRSELRKVSELTSQPDVPSNGMGGETVVDANQKQLDRSASGRLVSVSRRSSQKNLMLGQPQLAGGIAAVHHVHNTAAVTHTVQLFTPPPVDPNLNRAMRTGSCNQIAIKPMPHVPFKRHTHKDYARQYFGESACEVVPPRLSDLAHNNNTLDTLDNVGDGSITLSPTSPHVMFDVPGGDLYSPGAGTPVFDLRLEGNLQTSYVGLHRDDDRYDIDLAPPKRPGALQVGQLANLMDMFVAEESPGPLIRPRKLHVHDELGVTRYESLSDKQQSYSRSRRNSAEHGSLSQSDPHTHTTHSMTATETNMQGGGVSTSISTAATKAQGVSQSHRGSTETAHSEASSSSGQYIRGAVQGGQYMHPQPPLASRPSGTGSNASSMVGMHTEGPRPPTALRSTDRAPSPAHAHAAAAQPRPPPPPANAHVAHQAAHSDANPSDSLARLPPRPRTASNKSETALTTTKPPETSKVPQIMQDLPLPSLSSQGAGIQPPTTNHQPNNPLMPAPRPMGLGGIAAILNTNIPSSAPHASALAPLHVRGREASLPGQDPALDPGAPTTINNLGLPPTNPGQRPKYRPSQDISDDAVPPQSYRSATSPFRRAGSLTDPHAKPPTAATVRVSTSGTIMEGENSSTQTNNSSSIGTATDAQPPITTRIEPRLSASYDAPAWVDMQTVGKPSGCGATPPRPRTNCTSLSPGSPATDTSHINTPPRPSQSGLHTHTGPDYSPVPVSASVSSTPPRPPLPASGSPEPSATPPRAPHRPPVHRSMLQSLDSALSSSLTGTGGSSVGPPPAAPATHSRHASPMAPPRGGASSCLVRSRDASPAQLRASVSGIPGTAAYGHASRDSSPAARCGMTSLTGDPPLPAYQGLSGPSLLPSTRHDVDMSDVVLVQPGGPLPGVPLFISSEALNKASGNRDMIPPEISSSSSYTSRGTNAHTSAGLLPALPGITSRNTSRHNSRDPSPSNGRVALDPLNHQTTVTTAANALVSSGLPAAYGGGGGVSSRSSSVDRLRQSTTNHPTATTSTNAQPVLGHGKKPLDPQSLVPMVPLRPGLERELMQAAHEIRGGPAWRPNGAPLVADQNSNGAGGASNSGNPDNNGNGGGRAFRTAHVLQNPSQVPQMTQATVYIHRGGEFDLVKN